MEQAQRMQEIMPSQHPSFSKLLKRSNVSDKFYLHIPDKFCKLNLPRGVNAVILMGENEQEYSARYDAKQRRLMCGGWKDFSIAHNLLDGDTVDFHMIEPCKFKVHIARASRSTDNPYQNTELGDTVQTDDLIEENTCVGHTTTQEYPVSHSDGSHQIDEDIMTSQNRKRMRLEVTPTEDILPVTVARADRSTELDGADGNTNSNIHDSPWDAEHTGIAGNEKLALVNIHEITSPILYPQSTPLEDQRDECCADVDSAVSLGSKSTDRSLNFKDVKGFMDFKIYVHGEALDAEIPEQSRVKYYELCCSQNKFLHGDLVDSLSHNLVAAMILEIIKIADALKSETTLVSTVNHLEGMDRTLKSFEVLGMTVGFLRARISEFVKLLNEYQTVTESTNRGLIEIERERTSLHAEKAKIDELMQSATARESLIGSLESKVDSLKEESQRMFDKMKAACSAW